MRWFVFTSISSGGLVVPALFRIAQIFWLVRVSLVLRTRLDHLDRVGSNRSERRSPFEASLVFHPRISSELILLPRIRGRPRTAVSAVLRRNRFRKQKNKGNLRKKSVCESLRGSAVLLRPETELFPTTAKSRAIPSQISGRITSRTWPHCSPMPWIEI